ncbi:MAG: MBL fold metallo-hydrolase [Candidatus Peregrinibacteria bacterium]|nr:MBL fold metallo-hydrolase [Candidatus Peregrinibacteria bacterium]
MKLLYRNVAIILSLLVLAACQSVEVASEEVSKSELVNLQINPISHATAVLEWDGAVIYSDPTGGAEAFAGQPSPDIAFVTDVHGDHLNTETLEAVLGDETILVVPQAVQEMLPQDLKGELVVLANGESTVQKGFSITAIPMYNLPESEDSRHVKGRGNGYVIEKDGFRLYFSGDTAGIPEMRSLEDIDIAFVCMNLPYTMDVEEAAEAVLEFKPAKVYPYHYRGQDGLSDVARFKELVNAGDSDIEVVQLDWYSETE